MNKYITTAIPYMNGEPHIGHAVDYCLADTAARYFRLRGDNVRFQVGTDEHGSKIFQKAKELNQPVEEYVTKTSNKFKDFISKLNISYTDFIRTTDQAHEERVQKIWQKLENHIYLAKYEGWYCTGCERFITDKEYTENNGICPDHQKPYEKLEEENYYFKISDFKDRVKAAIESNKMRILPEFRKKEILKLIEDTPDVSISRPRAQLTWGVPVPGNDNQVMYVWLDALSNYITVLGYPDQDISDWWPAALEIVGKDILRFHAILWPAMLIALDLPLPEVILSHGMVLANGEKMSKSIGNVVEPLEVIKKHGLDAFRYYFLRHIDTFSDSDFSWEKFEDAYNNELANDLGNLVQRLSTLAAKNGIRATNVKQELPSEYVKLMDNCEFSKAMDFAWGKLQDLNRRINEEKPWELAKNGQTNKLTTCLQGLIGDLQDANRLLSPFLPNVTAKIQQIFTDKIIAPEVPLFPKQ